MAAVPEDFAETAVIPLIALCMAVTGCAVDCSGGCDSSGCCDSAADEV